MTTTTVTDFRKNIFEYVNNAIRNNDPVHVVTRTGSAVMMSEEEYNSLVATVELTSVPGLAEQIKAASAAPDDEYTDAEELGW